MESQTASKPILVPHYSVFHWKEDSVAVTTYTSDGELLNETSFTPKQAEWLRRKLTEWLNSIER
jgi:hypothetical protein